MFNIFNIGEFSKITGLTIKSPLWTVAASLAAIVCFVLALAPFFLPRELAALWSEPPNIADLRIAPDGRRAILVTWRTNINERQGLRRRLTIHELDGSRPPRMFLSVPDEPGAMKVSVEGGRLFAGTSTGAWQAIDLSSAGERLLARGRHPGEGLIDLLGSSDGQMLVTRGAACLCAWNVASGTIRWQRNDLDIRCWDVTAGGIVCGSRSGQLVELDLATGRTTRRVRRDRPGVHTLKSSPCGRYLAETAWDGTLQLMDYRTGECVWQNRKNWPGAAGSRIVTFSPCGRYLVTLHERDLQALVAWSTDSGHKLHELRGHRDWVVGAAFHPAGELYSWSSDGQLRAWTLESGSRSRVVSSAAIGLPLAAVDARKGPRRP